MQRRYFVLLAILFSSPLLVGQVIPDSMRVDWNQTGYEGEIPDPETILNVMDYGAVGDGVTNDYAAIVDAIEAAGGGQAVIYFPEGTYLIGSSLTLPSGVILRGLETNAAALHFDLNDQPQDCISIYGNAVGEFIGITNGLAKGSSALTVQDAAQFSIGDYAELRQENGEWDSEPAPWAKQVVGQVVKIVDINGETLSIDQPLRIDMEITLNPEIRKIEPIMNVGVECITVHRADSVPEGSGANIKINLAANCWVIGVESYKSVSAHIDVITSKNIEITGNYIHHAFTYDGEGKRGYGVTLNNHASDCLIENNIFRYLRHAMMVKTGANGNVFAYNYSIDPNRPEFPTDGGGDISLHGHYPYANLFEGNIIQNIVIDHYWGPAGPYNTFFRNRAELYGIISTPASVETDYQNFVGNEVTNTQPLHGNYSISGEMHFEYGNNVKGTIIPSGTDDLTDESYYLDGEPVFWNVSADWPSIGIPNGLDEGTIPGEVRYMEGEDLTICPGEETGINDNARPGPKTINIYPNPAGGMVYVKVVQEEDKNITIRLTDLAGRTIKKIRRKNTEALRMIIPDELQTGMYLIQVELSDKLITRKLMKK